mmetsp:Transcript_35675/g.93773  ORF Transcript_35675/g.93773 Transcript_35675/m.93773 type:complete len:249 (-) Transcript_35675:758-1504(-)
MWETVPFLKQSRTPACSSSSRRLQASSAMQAQPSAMAPPTLVPQIRSNIAPIGRPPAFSSARSISSRLRPLTPPPSRDSTRIGLSPSDDGAFLGDTPPRARREPSSSLSTSAGGSATRLAADGDEYLRDDSLPSERRPEAPAAEPTGRLEKRRQPHMRLPWVGAPLAPRPSSPKVHRPSELRWAIVLDSCSAASGICSSIVITSPPQKIINAPMHSSAENSRELLRSVLAALATPLASESLVVRSSCT